MDDVGDFLRDPDATPLPLCMGCGRPEGDCDCDGPANPEGLCVCGSPTIDGCRWCPMCSELGGEG